MQSSVSRFFCFLRSLLRKWTPVLFFLLIGAALLVGRERLLDLTSYVYHATGAAGPNMSGAEVAAESQAAGWVPFGVLTSKLLTAAGAFVLACILVWRMQRLVLPGPARWAKQHSPTAFNFLTVQQKFKVYHAGRWQLVVLAVASLLFAALVQ